jgi:SAM-dependent methyltransferase
LIAADGSATRLDTSVGAVERLPVRGTSPWWGEHRSRYRFAERFVAGKSVLDIACGTGFGTDMLARMGATHVTGCDAFPSAVLEARREFRSKEIRFVAADGTRLPFANASFDAVVSFETLEHIAQGEDFVRELRRVLRPGGTLLLSTPNVAITSQYPRNPFHLHEYTASELSELLSRYFRRVEIRGQLLGPKYRVAPFLPGRDRARSGFDHVRLVVWKLMNRLPFRAKDSLSRAFLGRHFYPTEEDYQFLLELDEAPVLLATCRL